MTDVQVRALTFEVGERAEKSDLIPVVVSSDAPVEMRDGPEVLVHTAEAIDLSRAPLPIIASHRDGQVNVGIVENLRVDGGKLRGDARFGDRAEAAGYKADVLNRIIRSVSIKYERIKTVAREGVWITSRWMPMHVAMVAEPADAATGFYRSVANDENAAKVKPATPDTSRSTSMADPTADEIAAREAAAKATAEREKLGKDKAKELEAKRVVAIRQIAGSNGIGEDQIQAWIGTGSDWNQIGDDIVAIHAERAKNAPRSVSVLGLGAKETRDYSLSRAILACHEGNWDDAGLELECHKEIANRVGKPMRKNQFFVPFEIQRRPAQIDLGKLSQRMASLGLNPTALRDLNVATTTQGGFLVQTSIQSFDELLRNISFAFRMGVTRLSGLRDPITIPRQSAAATAVWLANETSTITESTQAFVQLAMSPKSVGAYTEISDLLLKQSSIDAEGFVTADLAAVAALAADVAVLSGSGASGQPTGLDNTAGIGSVTGTSLAFDDILEFQTDVAAGNVMPLRGGYVTTPAVASLCIQRVKYASTASPLWEGSIWEGTMQGFPAMSTNQVAAATMYFGDWSKIIIGEWGTLEITTNPYANFQAGIIGVRALYSMDVGVRYPVAFSRATSIT